MINTIYNRKKAYMDGGFTASWASRLAAKRTDEYSDLKLDEIYSMFYHYDSGKVLFRFPSWHVFCMTQEGSEFWLHANEVIAEIGIVSMMQQYPDFGEFYEQFKRKNA